jgi:hypothetical protein
MDIIDPESERAGSLAQPNAPTRDRYRATTFKEGRALRLPLRDSTKSEMRGAISARNREPLKTP